MRNIYNATLIALFTLFFYSSSGQIVTDIDGNNYTTVTIGTQEWLKENLKTTKLTDGTPISLITDNTAWMNTTSAAYCWYNNDQALNGSVYGALYNWYTVNTNKLCPNGWHVPSNTEWQTLVDYLGGASEAGNKLKEAGTAHWYLPNTGATNESGFTALPGGQRGAGGIFDIIKGSATFWTSTEVSATNAMVWALFYHSGFCQNVGDGKEAGKSVRCIKGGVNSLEDTDETLNYIIYPNPSKNKFYVQQRANSECILQVFDFSGRMLQMKKFVHQTSVSITQPGIYNIRLQDKNGSYSEVVMIQE